MKEIFILYISLIILTLSLDANIIENINSQELDPDNTHSVTYDGIMVSGVIDQDTTWSDTIFVTGDVTINNGITLTIDPGSTIKFTGHYKLNVQGRLLAVGTENDSIVFTKQDYVHYWDGWAGIHFNETPTVNDSSKFKYCRVTRCYNGDISNAYGGAFFIKEFSKLRISHTEIYNNYVNAQDSSAGGYGWGAAIYCEYSSPLITYSSIHSNISCGNGYWQHGTGGGLFLINSSPKIMNTIIRDNEAQYGCGGGICCSNNSNPLIINSIFNNNQSDWGGAIISVESKPIIINSTIVNNYSTMGGGIICTSYSSPIITNSILFNNTPEEIYLSPFLCYNSITISYSDIEGGETGIIVGHGDVHWLEGNIDLDPLFENGYHLSYCSPCIDAGTPDTTGLNLPPWDLDGNIRIWDGNGDSLAIVDMGCYEFGAPFYGVDDPPHNQIGFQIYPNYPNPFSNSTNISFNIPRTYKTVQVKIYNIKGQLVKTIDSNNTDQLSDEVVWDGKDDLGRTLSNGIYLYQLTGKNYTSKIMKMILLR